jgi:peptidoglycan/LPS O-acetylase OafA/YrhL
MSETEDELAYERARKYLLYLLVGMFVVSFLLPLYNIAGKDLSLHYNPTVVNGILTATAILYGFAANEIRRFEKPTMKLLVLLLMMVSLMVEVLVYFNDTLKGENPTILTLYLSMAVFLLSILMVVFSIIAKQLGA